MVHAVVGVVGASGGLGASTLGVALAVRASRRFGVCVAVDARSGGGGLDVTAGLEHLPGLRWGDLAESRGEVDGAAVLTGLPHDGGLRVLAARGSRPRAPVERAVVAGLAQVSPVTVLDLGRRFELVELCTHLVLVAGSTARRLADATAVVREPALAEVTPWLVLRTRGRDPVSGEAVAAHLDLPLAGVLREDPGVRGDEDRALVPGTRGKGSLATLADRVLDAADLVVTRPVEWGESA